MQHQTIAVLGGSGLIGSHLVNRLVTDGRRVKVATRRRENAKHLTMLPVDVIEVDPFNVNELNAFIRDADAVVNLIGILHSRRGRPYGSDFARVHVDLPREIARACVAQHVHRLIHVSALGADPKAASMYLRSKAAGEQALHEMCGANAAGQQAVDTTIFRPSVVFGPGDALLNRLAALQRVLPVVPLVCSRARLQPIYAGDVAQAILNSLDLANTYGKTFELGGPYVYTFTELAQLVGHLTDKNRRILGIPNWLARLQACVFECLPGEPVFSRDTLDMLRTDNVMSEPLAPELGLKPVSIEATAPAWLTGVAPDRFSTWRRIKVHR